MRNEPALPGPTVVSEKPYQFVPPRASRFWPWIAKILLNPYLRRIHGIESWEIRGQEKISASLKAGHGILIVPNHCNPADPMSVGLVAKAIGSNINMMASAHLFLQSSAMKWLLPRIGAFSVYREGMDRESLKTAVGILAAASRPLVIFAEGVITRTNDRLISLQDGVAFIARAAAKQRAESDPSARVVIHPLAMRYTFGGDVEQSLAPVLDKIEARLSWQPQGGLGLHQRVVKLGHALLALKEVEYEGTSQPGTVNERLTRLIDHVLGPLEQEWLSGRGEDSVVQRVKNLRKAILPGLIDGEVTEAERTRRWKQLYDLEVAQQIFHFPPDYLGASPTPTRLIETVQRYEEALGNPSPAVHRPLHLRIDVGDAIEVSPKRDKRAPSDPLMDQLRASLVAMLDIADPQQGAS